MTTEIFAGLTAQLTDVQMKLEQLLEMHTGSKEQREWYTVEEAAKRMTRAPFTVREWCREGRIHARKRLERRGGAVLWNISASEIARIKDQGLLPPDSDRNAA